MGAYLPPKNAKKFELFGETFYAVREIMGYMGSGLWGSTQEFCQKHGWNLYNAKGAFITGGTGKGGGGEYICCPTLKQMKKNFLGTGEVWIKRWAAYEPKGIPFQFYN